MILEQFAIIKDFPKYAVSTHGRVINIHTGFIYKPHSQGKHYQVELCMDGRKSRKVKLIHRLMAEAFIPNPLRFPYIDHIDRNSFNNEITNLRWVNARMNNENRRPFTFPKEQSVIRTNYVNKLGEHHIRMSGNKYRLHIGTNSIKIDKTFETLEEAINVRDKLINDFNTK
jgi:hypothetical protein